MHIRSSSVLAPPHPTAELEQLGAFDARGGWNTGFRSCAAWLSWRVGLDLGAARERVRVARALGTLPLLAQALAHGQLSYAKVRALTRVATPETEARLLAVGRAGTAAHVERIVRGWRCVDRRAEAREAKRRHARRALHVYHDEDGTVVLRGRLEPEMGALLLQALAAARENLYQRARQRDRATATGPTAARRRCRILRSSVAGIIGRCTRRATRSRACPTGRSSSGGRTGAHFLAYRRLLRCPLIRSRRSGS